MSVARALTIAGSDSGGGAGVQADLKTFAAHGVYGLSAITAITAQNTRQVRDVLLLEPDLVVAQIDAVLDDLGTDAIKIGMLGAAPTVDAVARRLTDVSVPVVVDPVMISKSGDELLDAEAVEVLREQLLPRADLVTPNVPELGRLSGMPVGGPGEREAALAALAAGGTTVLLKGGHLLDDPVVDVLAVGGERHVFRHPRLETRHTHGTGCTLSAAIAARLARGEALVAAVEGALDYVERAMRAAPGLGGGHGPLGHFHRLEREEIA